MKDKIRLINDLCAEHGTYINQHGKRTVSAWSKIKYFREVFGTELGINCVMIEHSQNYVIMKCVITKSDPEQVLSTGYSKQYRDKPGYIEIAETFAITRAMSFLGILLEDITSAEEYKELDIPVHKVNGKDTSNGKSRYDPFEVDDLIKRVGYAPHVAKLDFLWKANKQLIDQVNKSNDLSTYRRIVDTFENKRVEIQKHNEV